MIKNEKQYQVTKSRLKEFSEALARLEKAEIDPLSRELSANALKSQIEEFQEEIEQYEQVKTGKVKYVFTTLGHLSEALIKARISKGWTQADLARKLEIKEQQVQRYEGSDYSTASISRITEVAAVLGARIFPIKIQISNPEAPIPTGFNETSLSSKYEKMKEAKNSRGGLITPETGKP